MNEMQTKILNWETAESQTGMEHYLGLQTVSDKAIADCVEALIGVYLRVSLKTNLATYNAIAFFIINIFIFIEYGY